MEQPTRTTGALDAPPDATSHRRRSDRRGVLALLLAWAAVAAAVAAAVGPATPERARFSWPPTDLPSAAPERMWLAPLLLARESPQTFDAELPCGNVPTLSEAGHPVVILATTRNALAAGGLGVVRSANGRGITVRVGGTTLARLATRSDPGCSFRVHFEGGSWRIGTPDGSTLRGTSASPPRVYGLLTELDLEADPPLRVTVEPFPQDTRPSTRQTALRILAALLLAGGILLVVAPTHPRRISRPRVARPVAQDGFVVATLVAWWVLAPLQDDDGWVRARQLNSVVSGGLSNYYRDWGANLPLGTWLEWLQHFLLAHTSALAYERLPALVALVAAWLLCRWCLARGLDSAPTRQDVAWWSATLAFAVGAVAFGMTLRPEPLIALLAVGALACSLVFAEKPSLGPLTLALLLGVLAVTIYPSGIVAAAPFLLSVPRAIRSARGHGGIVPLRLAALLPIGAACAMLLVFLDADKTTWNESTRLGRLSGSHSKGIFDEVERYRQLADEGAPPLRRLFVALLLLVVLAFVVARLRRTARVRLLPSASVTIGLVLLALTPSKLIWHFGGLVGLCAVAIGFEVRRLTNAQLSRAAHVLLLVPLVTAAVWSASKAYSWGPLDVGSIDWSREPAFFLAAVLVGLVAVHVADPLALVRKTGFAVLPALLFSLLGVTMLFFTVDAAATNGWTTARQTASSLVGRDGCGVASAVDVALPSSDPHRAAERHRNAAVAGPPPVVWTPLDLLLSAPGVSTLAAPTVLPALPCARLPSLVYGVAAVPDVIVNYDFCMGLRKPSCTFSGLSNLFRVAQLPQRSLVGRGFLPVYRVRLDPRDAIAPAERSTPR